MKYDGLTVRAWAGDSQWRAWRADLAKFRANGYSGFLSETFWAITIYRLQRGVRNRRPKLLWLPVKLVLGLAKKFTTIITHINLNPSAQIGPGFLLPHVGPIQINPETIIGADCTLMHVVTLGAGSKWGNPTLGDHVFVGCHACVLGGITLGDFVDVGAGAVVLSDIPARSIAVGVPARAISKPPEKIPAVVSLSQPANS